MRMSAHGYYDDLAANDVYYDKCISEHTGNTQTHTHTHTRAKMHERHTCKFRRHWILKLLSIGILILLFTLYLICNM